LSEEILDLLIVEWKRCFHVKQGEEGGDPAAEFSPGAPAK